MQRLKINSISFLHTSDDCYGKLLASNKNIYNDGRETKVNLYAVGWFVRI